MNRQIQVCVHVRLIMAIKKFHINDRISVNAGVNVVTNRHVVCFAL